MFIVAEPGRGWHRPVDSVSVVDQGSGGAVRLASYHRDEFSFLPGHSLPVNAILSSTCRTRGTRFSDLVPGANSSTSPGVALPPRSGQTLMSPWRRQVETRVTQPPVEGNGSCPSYTPNTMSLIRTHPRHWLGMLGLPVWLARRRRIREYVRYGLPRHQRLGGVMDFPRYCLFFLLCG